MAEPHTQPAPNPSNALALAGIGGGLLALVVLIVVLVRGGGSSNTNTNQNNVNVTVPVSVSLDDWAKAREPGVVLVLGDKQMAFSDFEKVKLPPGHHVVVARKDGVDVEAREFDVKEGDAGKALAARPVALASEVRRWRAKGAVTCVAFAPDGNRFMATECEGNLFGPLVHHFTGTSGVVGHTVFYDAATSTVRGQCSHNLGTRSAYFPSNDAALVYAIAGNADVYFTWFASAPDRSAQYRQTPVSLTERFHALVASPDEKRFLYATTATWGLQPKPTGVVRVCRIQFSGTERTIEEINGFDGATGCFDPTGERVLTALNTQVRLWDEKTGKPLREYLGAKAGVESVAMGENGSRVAAGDVSGTVYAWMADAKEPSAVCKGHKGKVNAVGVTNDGARVVSAGEDGTVRVWDASTGTELHQYKHDGPVYALAMSPGGKRVLTGGADKTIRLWQLPP